MLNTAVIAAAARDVAGVAQVFVAGDVTGKRRGDVAVLRYVIARQILTALGEIFPPVVGGNGVFWPLRMVSMTPAFVTT